MIRNERGNMTVTLILGTCAFLAALALLDTFKASNIALGYATDRGRVDPPIDLEPDDRALCPVRCDVENPQR